MKKLAKIEVSKKLKRLSGWKKARGRNAITKTFKFDSFVSAFNWMTAIAFYAEQKNHHPEWFNVYNSVDVTLSTHDSGGITQLDIDMAKKMNSESNKK